jgi:hypothetical protein
MLKVYPENFDCELINKTPQDIARKLFFIFRKFDSENKDLILIERIGKTSDWSGVRNRITKAASKIVN